jgi:hypothetical protein
VRDEKPSADDAFALSYRRHIREAQLVSVLGDSRWMSGNAFCLDAH